MGMSAAGAGGSGRGGRGHRRRGRHHGLMSEINVTPMVDVMLVLLIIFMVAAPLLTVGVPIDLPDTQAKAMNVDTQPITVSIDAAGKIFLQETEIPIEELVAKLQAISKTGYDERIFIRGDKSTDYG
ncbi:MAG: biopolymer transporter ExbD, partial [Mesorhizobium sp.]